VPHFGTFTFTSAPVDLEGVTNPSARDRDLRAPVFILASDFAPSIRAGISHDTGIRPYTARGFSGKVPTVSLNYTELARLTSIDKEACKRSLDQGIRELSESAKAGQDVRKQIPSLGTFVVKSGIAAVIFEDNVLKPLAGPGHLTPDGEDWLRTNLGIEVGTQKSEAPRPLSATARTESAPKTAVSIKALLTSPVDFLLENQARVLLIFQMRDQGSTGLLSFEDLSQCVAMLDNSTLTDDLLRQLVDLTNAKSGSKVRYRDLMEGIKRFKTPRAQTATGARSDFTDNYSRASVVPLARKLWDCKVALTDLAQKGGMRPRIKTSASELLGLLKKAHLNVNIHQLRAFLREDGLDPSSSSVLDLIGAARSILKPETGDLSVFSDLLSSRSVRPRSPRDSDKMQEFFQSHSIKEVLFRAKNDSDMVTLSNFMTAVQEIGRGTVKALEAQREFLRASKGRNELSVPEFWEAFQPRETRNQLEERGFGVLRQWLKDEQLSSEQGFREILDRVGAAEKLTKQQFATGMQGFALSSADIEGLFDAMDTKRDQFIDLAEWLNKIYEVDGPYQALRDILLKANIPKADLTAHLNLIGKDSLTDQELIAVLQRMDNTLTVPKASNIAATVLRGRGTVPVQELLAQLTKDQGKLAGDWVDQVYARIRKKLGANTQRLRAVFEAADLKHIGKMPIVEFQDCLFRASLGLDSVDIQRLARIVDQADSKVIDYYRFLEKVSGPDASGQDPFRVTVERLQSFMQQNNVNPEILLAKMGSAVPILNFANFLSSKVYQRLSPADMAEIASKMDLNGDGLIDAADVTAVVNARNRVSFEGRTSVSGEVLSLDKARSVLTELRNSLIHRKISYSEAFKKMDIEGTGMVSFPNFMAGVDKLVQLSEPVKEGLFRLLDTQGIGLVDYPTFLRIVRDSDMEQKQAADNWNWEQDILSKIKDWMNAEKLTVEAVFRAFDRDFDGVLSKKDLRESLESILKLENILPSKIDRLYKLLDAFKRDSVQLADFKSIFEDNRRPEWKSSAKQQIGLQLSKLYQSLPEAFELISEYSGKITFAQFKQFIDTKDVLAGFNLTLPLLQELFVEIDIRRKGYISDMDWNAAFAGHQSKLLSLQELKDTLRANFADMESAFDFFLSFHLTQPPGKLQLSEFEAAIDSLIPRRFSKQDIRALWQSIAHDRSYIDFKEFAAAFSDLRFASTFSSRKSSRLGSDRASNRSASTGRLSALSEDDPFRRLHNLLKSSPKPLEEIFREMDADSSGKLSAIEFRNALRSLNLGLTARDIDQLIFRVDTNADGQIDWIEFSHKFQPSESESRIKSVTQQRLNKLRNNMFSYMLSPRDAFRQFDSARSGRLEFAAFNTLVRKLYELSGEAAPAFSVIKDLFDVVDSRKDGYLDIKEWLSVFKQQGTEGQSWEDTRAFQDVARTIGKNRKMLLLTFEATSRDGKVSYQSAKDVLSTVLRDAALTEEQWRQIVRPAEREGMVDFKQLLDIYKERASARDLHPRAS
jgi:Ca2+-binding EF-hand superfamily protein